MSIYFEARDAWFFCLLGDYLWLNFQLRSVRRVNNLKYVYRRCINSFKKFGFLSEWISSGNLLYEYILPDKLK